jgi:DNA-binding transcriptional regulator YiaG
MEFEEHHMTTHAGDGPDWGPNEEFRVQDGMHRRQAIETLVTYDATKLVGLRVIVHNAAVHRVDEGGEETTEVPKLRELLASSAVSRCIMPCRLRGWEIKAIRRIMGLTLNDFAHKLDERTAAETVSRWESEAQPMGGFAEKTLRLVVCEELRKEAPGVTYDASMIANLHVLDPWRIDAEYELPYLHLELVRVKEQSGTVIDAWDRKMAA